MQDDGGGGGGSSSSATTTTAPVETSLVGLSPTYWAHVPLSISQIHQLELIHGVHCYCYRPFPSDEQKPKGDSTTACHNNSAPPAMMKIVPISKCRVVACIVSLERRAASGSALYVLDDGTGLLDCISWQDDLMEDALPPLVEHPTISNNDFNDSNSINNHLPNEYYHQFQVGDMVEVFGRIECVAILSPLDNNNNNRPRCVRELHLSMLRLLPSCGSRPTSDCCLDSESKHMMQVSSTGIHDPSTSLQQLPLYNATDVLDWLGPEISFQIQQKEHFPSVHDKVGAWRLFGIQCPCGSGGGCQDLKDALLYCHCIAKKVDLDPDWSYRDALLRVLLQMERKLNDDTAVPHTASDDTTLLPLFVHYQELVNNSMLEKKAEQQVKRLDYPATAAKQVLLRTIRTLCDDGILHLYDAEMDTYLLISRATVLEPYVRLLSSKKADDMVVRSRLFTNRPVFLQRVPKARLQLVRRLIAESETMDTESD